MKITSNHHWRELVTFYDLPAHERPDFDYVGGKDKYDEDTGEKPPNEDEDERYSPRFVCYRGVWHDLNEFMPVPRGWTPPDWSTWSGYQSDSYFSGILIRCSEDCERVQLATFIN